MAQYRSIVAGNPNVEMIHVSLDNNKRAAQGWAAADKLPWYTVLPKDAEKSGFMRYWSNEGVPEYALVTADGKRIGKGSEVFGQVKELTSK